MNRWVSLAGIAVITLVTATPAFAQGRFGNEAKERAADRAEREAIRRAEHPEQYQAVAGNPAVTRGQAAIPEPATEAAAESAPIAQPAPEPAAAPAQ